MKHLLSISILIGLITGCGVLPDPNASCDAVASCQGWEEEVQSCDGLEDCRVEEMCGRTTFCIPRQLSASDYDQSCTVASDCALINEGSPCDCHVCPDGAINVDAVSYYQLAETTAECSSTVCPAIGCGEDLVAACVSGTCEVRTATYASADDFDRSCEVDADCAAVYEGEICAECQCPNTAVNVSALEDYGALFDETCLSDQPCPCAGADAVCVDNVCQFDPAG